MVDRFASIGAHFEPILEADLDETALARLTEWVQSDFEADLKRRLAQFTSPEGKLFWNRLLGTRRFQRLKRALADDGALLLVALRRMLRYCLPLAQAIQDAAGPLPAKTRSEFTDLNFTEYTLVHLSMQMDAALDKFMSKQGVNLEELDLPYRPEETRLLGVEVDDLIATLRLALSQETMQRADDISDRLGRKLRGFEQALEMSEDGVSQAATSLVEFIDRLLRDAFDEEYVLAWAAEHFPGDSRMTYTPNESSKPRPTKRAQALCFVLAGQKPNETDALSQLMAVSLVEVRSMAQKIKHADEGTAEEKELLRELMQAVRGSITFTTRLGWALAGDDRLDYLRDRFAKAA